MEFPGQPALNHAAARLRDEACTESSTKRYRSMDRLVDLHMRSTA